MLAHYTAVAPCFQCGGAAKNVVIENPNACHKTFPTMLTLPSWSFHSLIWRCRSCPFAWWVLVWQQNKLTALQWSWASVRWNQTLVCFEDKSTTKAGKFPIRNATVPPTPPPSRRGVGGTGGSPSISYFLCCWWPISILHEGFSASTPLIPLALIKPWPFEALQAWGWWLAGNQNGSKADEPYMHY